MTSTTVKPDIHSCEYDEAQDMLFVLFAPIQGHDYYETTAADPDLLLRYTDKGARLIGLSLHNPLPRLNGAPATPAAIRQLAEELVKRYDARQVKLKKATRKPRENRHVTPRPDGRWSNKRAGAKRATSIHSTQEAAVKRAKRDLRKSGGGEVIVHLPDGGIRKRDTVLPTITPTSSNKVKA